MKRYILIVLVLVSLIASVIYLNKHNTTQKQLLVINGATMGTTYNIKLASGQGIALEVLKEQVSERLNGIDNKMSTYKKDSEVSRFNRHPISDWMPVSAETLNVVAAAHRISQLSDGAFDITIGNLVNLWGFGPTVNLDTLPDGKMIETLRSQVGYLKLKQRQESPALLKTSAAVYIDLSAIAKGYAVDAVAQLLLENKIDNFLVEIGGEIVTHGEKQPGRPWVIGIERPVAGQRSIQKRLSLFDIAMATSGDYRNYFEHQGVRYSHTINPTTGYPIKHQLASVTVIDDSCMRADALATAITVLGPDHGMEFAENHHLAIYMLIKQDDHFIEKYSTAFKPYLNEQGD